MVNVNNLQQQQLDSFAFFQVDHAYNEKEEPIEGVFLITAAHPKLLIAK